MLLFQAMGTMLITTPQIFLAPMAGLSDAPMRALVAGFGVDAVISEMIASQEWHTEREGVAERAERGLLPENVRFITQIAGRDPVLMADVALFARDHGADQIDINMGCPAKKVTSGATAGAALLREPELALEIVEAVIAAVDCPVSVKTRLGWERPDVAPLLSRFEAAGVSMITLHGRTRAQKYNGVADWAAAGEMSRDLTVPVVINGDIDGVEAAKRALAQSGASGVMIGRAAMGRPWLPAHIRAGLAGDFFEAPVDLAPVIAAHYEAILAFYGGELGVRVARKHLKAYFEAAPWEFLAAILRENDPAAVMRMIHEEWAAAC